MWNGSEYGNINKIYIALVFGYDGQYRPLRRSVEVPTDILPMWNLQIRNHKILNSHLWIEIYIPISGCQLYLTWIPTNKQDIHIIERMSPDRQFLISLRCLHFTQVPKRVHSMNSKSVVRINSGIRFFWKISCPTYLEYASMYYSRAHDRNNSNESLLWRIYLWQHTPAPDDWLEVSEELTHGRSQIL